MVGVKLYEKFCGGDRILLWCENIESEKEQPPPSKRKTARRKDKEELGGVYLELKKRHGDKWPDPHLRLWIK